MRVVVKFTDVDGTSLWFADTIECLPELTTEPLNAYLFGDSAAARHLLLEMLNEYPELTGVVETVSVPQSEQMRRRRDFIDKTETCFYDAVEAVEENGRIDTRHPTFINALARMKKTPEARAALIDMIIANQSDLREHSNHVDACNLRCWQQVDWCLG